MPKNNLEKKRIDLLIKEPVVEGKYASELLSAFAREIEPEAEKRNRELLELYKSLRG